jgi:hypothetical protein
LTKLIVELIIDLMALRMKLKTVTVVDILQRRSTFATGGSVTPLDFLSLLFTKKDQEGSQCGQGGELFPVHPERVLRNAPPKRVNKKKNAPVFDRILVITKA